MNRVEPRYPFFKMPFRGQRVVIGCVATVFGSGVQIPVIREIFSALRALQMSRASQLGNHQSSPDELPHEGLRVATSGRHADNIVEFASQVQDATQL